jgi:hypothetical protein
MVNKCNEILLMPLFLPPSFFFDAGNLNLNENFQEKSYSSSTCMPPPLSFTLQLDKYLSKYTNHLVNSFTTFPCSQKAYTPKKKMSHREGELR